MFFHECMIMCVFIINIIYYLKMKDVEMVEEEKLKVMHDKDESNFNCTYSFNGEDHTLGNLLRCVLMKE